MIKTYVYTQPMNNISHILKGDGGNTVRFNFTNGNVITKKLPELTLRGEYYQNLLEGSDLFTRGLVRKVREVQEPSDSVSTSAEDTAAKKSDSQMEEIHGIRTTDEVIAYVNERFDKDCKTLATAMKYASKAKLIFPDYNE